MAQTAPYVQNSTVDSYTQTLRIYASPHELYQAVTTVSGLKGWWTDDTVANNDDITVRFGEGNFQTLRLLNLTPDKNVVWDWIAQHNPIAGTTQTDEWVGTEYRLLSRQILTAHPPWSSRISG